MSVHVDEIVTDVEVTDRGDASEATPTSDDRPTPPVDARRIRQLMAERRRQLARLSAWGFDD